MAVRDGDGWFFCGEDKKTARINILAVFFFTNDVEKGGDGAAKNGTERSQKWCPEFLRQY